MQPPKNTLRDADDALEDSLQTSQDAFPWRDDDEALKTLRSQAGKPKRAQKISTDCDSLEFQEQISSGLTTNRKQIERREIQRDPIRGGVSVTSRDEMNLAEFPLTVLSTRTNPHIKTLEFRDSQRLKTGELVEREWIITGADKFGLPTSTDDDVVLGLICLSMNHGFRDRKVHFTRYELLKILRWSTEGRSYSRLTKSLDRLSGVRIRATNAFFDNSLKAFQTVNFGILDAYEINDERSENLPRSSISRISNNRSAAEDHAERTKSFFVWSDLMFDSFKNGFIKKIDLDLYFTLKSAVARRLYRYLDKHFYYRDTLERPLMTLAFEKLGLSRTYKYVSSVKQQIEPALDELVELNFLSGYEFVNRGGVHLVRFYSQRSGAGGSVGSGPSSQPFLPSSPSCSGDRQQLSNPAHSDPALRNTRAAFSPQNSADHRAFDLREDFGGNAPELANAKKLQQVTKDPLTVLLLQRGLSRHQLEKLLASPTSRDATPRAVEYFDWLKTNSKLGRVKNLPGFLYRLIEEPSRIPEMWEENAPKAAPRPELKVIRADRTPDAPTNVVDPGRIQEFKERLSAEERSALYSRVEEKIGCLKGVLTRERFRDAVEGCVNEEISKMLREFPFFSMAGQS